MGAALDSAFDAVCVVCVVCFSVCFPLSYVCLLCFTGRIENDAVDI